jgi:hypothetical protein
MSNPALIEVRLAWAEKRSTQSREWALKTFLEMTPLRAADLVLEIERCHGNGSGERFANEVRAYMGNPVAWKRWARDFHKRAA